MAGLLEVTNLKINQCNGLKQLILEAAQFNS